MYRTKNVIRGVYLNGFVGFMFMIYKMELWVLVNSKSISLLFLLLAASIASIPEWERILGSAPFLINFDAIKVLSAYNTAK